jgi:hypothetical protein
MAGESSMTQDEFIETCKAAMDVPVVYSEPLARLAIALQNLPEDWEDDKTLAEVIDAAEEVANGWSFYPDDAYGSNLAIIDAETVLALCKAVYGYEQAAKP